jgi:hypothetical protein
MASGTVQSVDRAFAVLRRVADAPGGISDIARAVDLPVSTVARLLCPEPRFVPLTVVHEVVPLALRASVAIERVHSVPGGEALAVLTDEYRELVAAFDADGHVRVARLATGEIVADVAVVPGPVAPDAVSVPPGSTAFVVATADGRVIIQRVAFSASLRKTTRSIVGVWRSVPM